MGAGERYYHHSLRMCVVDAAWARPSAAEAARRADRETVETNARGPAPGHAVRRRHAQTP